MWLFGWRCLYPLQEHLKSIPLSVDLGVGLISQEQGSSRL